VLPKSTIVETGKTLTSLSYEGEPYRGKTLDGLLTTYNPDAQYARTVKFVMRSIAPSE